MGLNNPQGKFEDSIFGPNGTHPAPETLPYPSQKIKTIYGETIEYLIPEGQKEKVLKRLYPFGDPPALSEVWVDIHSEKEFTIGDFKVIEQNGYVMPVSPYFAEDGASVVDWEPKSAADDGMYVAKVEDEAQTAAFNAGYADGFTGMPKYAAKPVKPDGMDGKRYQYVVEAYEKGYDEGVMEHTARQSTFWSSYTTDTNRRTGRRPR